METRSLQAIAITIDDRGQSMTAISAPPSTPATDDILKPHSLPPPRRRCSCLLFLFSFITVLFLFLSLLKLIEPPDVECRMNVPQIIRRWGYPVETHVVATDDGYLLQLHRIPHGRNNAFRRNASCRPVIFLQHGLEMDSSNWVDNPPDQAAGFVFADAGFDVWIGNVRGNRYGKRHIYLNPDADDDFWRFSWTEMSEHDLPAMIDRALKVSGAPSLHYVGHSQGSLIMFARLAERPEFAKKISTFHALAPATSVEHVKGLCRTHQYLIPILQTWFTSGSFGPDNFYRKMLATSLCSHEFFYGICSLMIFELSGPQSRYFNASRTAVYFSHIFSGTSSQNIIHWTQMMASYTTQKYDYNDENRNRAAYNQEKPPTYDFSTVAVPLHLYWGANDYLASAEDIEGELIPQLNYSAIQSQKKLAEYNHFDFVWGTEAVDDIYAPIAHDVRRAERGRKCAV